MAGHSKWANIKHRKGRQDAKKSKFFTKAAKEIIIAAKAGGGSPDDNSRLRLAIQKARAVNLPKDKIDTAIKKGTGEIAGGDIVEITYEGYGPGGVAFLVEVATDNRNRSVAEVRNIIGKNGGNMGEAGSVAWMFERKGLLTFEKEKYTEEALFEIGMEAGIEDISDADDMWEVLTELTSFSLAQKAYEDANIEITSAELVMIATNEVPVEDDIARKILQLMDALEDNEDVTAVHVNTVIPDAIMEE